MLSERNNGNSNMSPRNISLEKQSLEFERADISRTS